MTTTTTNAGADWKSPEAAARVRKRHAGDLRLKFAGMAALGFAVLMLAILLVSLFANGYQALRQTHASVTFELSAEHIDAADPQRGNYRAIVQDAVQGLFPGIDNPGELRSAVGILSNGAQNALRSIALNDPSLIGQEVTIDVPLSDPYDQLAKGLVDRDSPEDQRRLKDADIALFDTLQARDVVSLPINWALVTNADSRFPELAGLQGAIWGSFYALLVCFVLSFPTGIAAGIYLEEFAPKNRLTDIVEININNLAAVPSVVFGLLALAVFIGWFGMPRSAPLVGGMTLALMTLPTIIIATRAALKAVPPSIREAALGVGASKHQVVLTHVLPLAMPGILTGTIIGLAQALGETAPLLLIGMNAFITEAPSSLVDSSTALPTQIFIWADSPERGFVARTSAAILVLLAFLIAMNAVAVFLRSRFERRY
ncbi:phosphate ABC transporter permease PstA [Rubrimonas cliftonensis]|uniref:Phosphate transport system permease protein PstA n=1 Tax=Rubrimonas cliftonensis TaxID=89524 RepID=A0A1H4FZ65_9RHOB|nr:phosphate ABC transporter permease PstA [Rubrimonas cliftonensis]SEB02605.1 phosphate ABC transporter membrane protein 2, PhoT family [Rubrimonas cliftonensis]